MRAHSGQFRRDKRTPYIDHPASVAKRLRLESEAVVATAWLHDVLEDTTETLETLRAAGLPEEVVLAVQILTKTEGMSYEAYLHCVRENTITRKVKVADMLSNLSDEPTARQIVKYAKGLLFLIDGVMTIPQ